MTYGITYPVNVRHTCNNIAMPVEETGNADSKSNAERNEKPYHQVPYLMNLPGWWRDFLMGMQATRVQLSLHGQSKVLRVLRVPVLYSMDCMEYHTLQKCRSAFSSLRRTNTRYSCIGVVEGHSRRTHAESARGSRGMPRVVSAQVPNPVGRSSSIYLRLVSVC